MLTPWQTLYNVSYMWRENEVIPRPVRLTIKIDIHTQHTVGHYNVTVSGVTEEEECDVRM